MCACVRACVRARVCMCARARAFACVTRIYVSKWTLMILIKKDNVLPGSLVKATFIKKNFNNLIVSILATFYNSFSRGMCRVITR